MIGYAERLVNYFNGVSKKEAQPIKASLFFRKDENLGIAAPDRSHGMEGLEFSLFPINEKHKMSFKVGDHPLQNGSVISDHVQEELQECTIECFLSNYPLKSGSKVTEFKFADSMASSEVKRSVSNSALERFETIKELARKKKPVRLVCSLEIYPKMVITDITYDRDEKSGSGIRFTMTLREIVTVDLKATTSTYVFKPADMESENNRRIASEVKLGKQSAKELDQIRELLNVETLE